MNSHTHEMKAYGDIDLFPGTAAPELAGKIAKYLQKDLYDSYISFPPDT